MKKALIATVATLAIGSSGAGYYLLSYAPPPAAVSRFEKAAGVLDDENKEIEKLVSDAEKLVKENAEPLEAATLEELKTTLADTKKAIRKVPKMGSDTSDIEKQVEELAQPVDYSNTQKELADKMTDYQKSVTQLKQITNPSREFVETRLKEIDTITGVQSVTEANDPNGNLNKQGGYTASFYFSDSQVTEAVDGSDIEDTGCEALEFNLTAVLYGDDYEARLQRLLKVLREHGSGELVHPIYGSVPDTAVADFEVRHSEDSPDYAEINISFKQSVAAAPFFGRELALALADEVDWIADLAAFQGFAVLEKGLGKIRNLQHRWNNFHAAVLNVVGRLYGQVNGVFSGSLNLLNSPRVLLTELKGVFGALAGMHRTAQSSLSGWRDLAGGTKTAAAVPWQYRQGLDNGATPARSQAALPDVAALTAAIAIVGSTALAKELADIFAAEQDEPELTPAEISRLLADVRAQLNSALAANRLAVMMLSASAEQAEQLAALLLSLYQDNPPDPEQLYRQLEQRRLLPQQPYLEGSAELADSVRTLAHTLQKQAQALINLRPPLVQKVVPTDSSLHLLAFLWYGDHSRQAELLRLNPSISHPNFITRGTVLNAYAQ